MFGQNLVAPFLLAAVLGSTTALAQVQAGRDAYSRGSIPWGCYTVRSPSASVYQTGNAANPQICADNCSVKRPQDASEPLFYYWQGSTQLCYCGNGYQNPSQQATAEYPCYTGVTDLRALWTSGRVSTTFTTFGTLCRTRAQVNLADSAFTVQGTAIGPYSCQNQCRSNRFAFWWADTTGNAQRCACSNTVVTAQNDVAACGPGNVFVYEHSVLAQASALNRRKIAAAAENAKTVELCPQGKLACAIRAAGGAYVENGFECIDTQSELESCGGCIDGVMQYNGTVLPVFDGVE